MSDIYRRCGCRDGNGKTLGINCPKLADPKHGTWAFYLAAGLDPITGKRRQIRKAGFPSKGAAQKARNEAASKVDKGTYRAPVKQTFGEYVTAWLPRHAATGRGLKDTTRFHYDRYIRLDIVPSALGRMPISEIRRFHVSAFAQALTDAGRGATTVHRIIAVVQTALRSAYEDQLIGDNPAIGVRLPRVQKAAMEAWTPEEAGAFLDAAAQHRLGALFEVVLFTGMRRGEVLGLRWADVDLAQRTITIRANRVQVGSKVVEQTPKTKAGTRTLEIADATVGSLVAWKFVQDAEAAAWGDAWASDGHVFTYEDGRALLPQYATRLFDKIRDKAGLPPMTFHGQRHEAISLMLSAGVPLAVVSKRAGHSSVQITADLYGHLIGSADRDAAETAVAMVPRNAGAHTVHTQEA